MLTSGGHLSFKLMTEQKEIKYRTILFNIIKHHVTQKDGRSYFKAGGVKDLVNDLIVYYDFQEEERNKNGQQ